MKTISRGKWVIDTQILVYLLDYNSEFHQTASDIFSLVDEGFVIPVIVHQNIIEAEKVFIRLYKQAIATVVHVINELVNDRSFTIIYPQETTLKRYHILMESKSRVQDIFDLYLAATMLDNGYNQIITANDKDFEGIEGIKIFNPWRK